MNSTADQKQSSQRIRLPLIFLGLLALQALTTFFSESRFVPGIANNFGAFETVFLVVFGAASAFFLLQRDYVLRFHPLMVIFGIFFVIALASELHYLSGNHEYGFIQVLILGFLFLFLVTLYNLLTLDESYFTWVLRALAISTALVGAWVLFDQLSSGGDYSAAGPFRNRTHSGIYMSGAFWILLVYSFWPRIRRWERWLTYPALGLALYCISASLRQSVYIAVLVGLFALTLGMFAAKGTSRLKIAIPAILIWSAGAVLFFNAPASGYVPLQLFYREFNGLERRLGQFSGTVEVAEGSRDFDDLQRRGGLFAFETSPVIGIGWGGFAGSRFSLTRHEMHSTPWRFLAELGLVGAVIYVSLMSFLLYRAVRLFWFARDTPYQLSALVLLIAIISCGVGHYYNRMFTDRPYWWILVIFMTFEYYLYQHLDKPLPQVERKSESNPKPGAIQPLQHG